MTPEEEKEFEKLYVKNADFYSGRPEPVNWLVPFVECSAENLKQFFSQLLQQRERALIEKIKQHVKNTIGINTNTLDSDIVYEKVFDGGGLSAFVDSKEYINKADLIRFLSLLSNNKNI